MDNRVLRVCAAAATGGLAGALGIELYLIVVESGLLHIASPTVVSQWDASNLLGRAAFSGGMASALLGFAMHLTVSLCWGIVFALLFARGTALVRHPLLLGALFGIVVMFVMRLAIVPLGHAVQQPLTLRSTIVLLIAHAVFFGMPLALTQRALLRSAGRARA